MSLIKSRVKNYPGNDLDEYKEFCKRITLDEHSIVTNIQDQAQVFLEVCERHTKALSRRDEARDLLARKDASVAHSFRISQEKIGARVTESIISDYVTLHPEHISFADDYNAKKFIADNWGNLREAFDHRVRMIRELVSVMNTTYHGTSLIGSTDDMKVIVARRNKEALDKKRHS